MQVAHRRQAHRLLLIHQDPLVGSSGANRMPEGAIIQPLTPQTRAFYCRAISHLNKAQALYLVGGAYALERYTGIERHTKDFDIFVKRRDYGHVMKVLSGVGCTPSLDF